jgi:peptide chain release factor 1
MIEKLEELAARYDELARMLSDPKVLSSQDMIRDIGKEHAELRDLMAVYGPYKKAETELAEALELSKDPDREMAELAKEEIPGLKEEIAAFEEQIKALLIPKDPLDGKNILIEIRAGTGGEEAGLFCKELFELYRRYAERKNWKTEILSSNTTGVGGLKEVIAQISGKEVYGHLRYESGVHRVQRVPATESQGRVHTSAVTVAVLSEAEDVEVDIDETDLEIDTYRAGGPGGQHLNTTDSAVRITHKPTNLVVTCQDERSQHKNKAKAMKILRARLLDLEQQKQQQERASMRKGMVGSGDRSEKIRTYNFPQGRLTDHRIGLTIYKLDRVMDGEIDEVVESLRQHDRAQQLSGVDKEENS